MGRRSAGFRVYVLVSAVALVASTASAPYAAASVLAPSPGPRATSAESPADTTPPTTPTGLTATAVGTGRIDLAWTASTDNVGVQGYRIYRDGSYVGTIGPVGSTSFSDTGLSASTSYTYTVDAIDAAGGASAQSSPATATTAGPDTAAPSVPSAVTASALAWNQVRISWAAATDNVGVTSYTVFRGGTRLSVVSGSALTFTDRSTAGSTAYGYTVKAGDAAGNTSAASTAAAVTTPAEPTAFLTSPWPNAAIFEVEPLAAEATDPGGVASVEFLVDGATVGTASSLPFTMDWDTTALADGPHTLTVRKHANDGGTSLSDPVPVTVANASPSSARLKLDYALGRLSLDDYVRFGVYALGAPVALPSRYRSSTPEDDGTSQIYDYLASYDQLQPSTQDEIDGFLDQPVRGDLYLTTLYPGAGGGASPGSALTPASGPPGIADSCGYYDFTPYGNATTGYSCTHDTAQFEISYVLLGTGDWADDSVAVTDADANGYPDYIDRVSKGLEDGFAAYNSDLLFPAGWLPTLVPVVLHPMNGGQVLPQGLHAGSLLDKLQTIEMDVDDSSPMYLAHHELFHEFEYQFVGAQTLGTLIFGPGLSGFRWWAEASAEWAAGFATRIGKTGDEDVYPHELTEFLGRPKLPLNHCECTGYGREYGSFVFAEYLVENLDHNPDGSPKTNPQIMFEIWDQIRSFPQDPVDVIQAVAGNHGTSLQELAPGFSRANYLLDYNDALGGGANDVETRWRPRLADDPRTADSTGFAPARPARDHRELVSGQAVYGADFINFGGAAYVELVPPPGTAAGELAVSIGGAIPSRLDAHVLTVNYPLANPANATVCIDTPITTDPNGNGTVSVPVTAPCSYAVLVFSAVDFTTRVGSEFGWSATFTLTSHISYSLTHPIAASDNHSFALESDGTAWTWGDQCVGLPGNGTNTGSNCSPGGPNPARTANFGSVASLAAASYHVVALRSDGTVWGWGDDEYGTIGAGGTGDADCGNGPCAPSPVQASATGTSTAVGAGLVNSYAVRSDGTVWAWGDNGNGELGIGTFTGPDICYEGGFPEQCSKTPVQVSGLTGVTAVAGGAYLSMALKSNGTVWTWGHGDQGQLGNGTTARSSTPVQVSNLSNAIAIAATNYPVASTAAAVLADGTVWTWGFGGDGQLGNGTTAQNNPIPVQVSNLNGITAVAGGWESFLALKGDGTVWTWPSIGRGGKLISTPVQVNSLSGVVAIAAGRGHNLAVKSNGTVWAWGDNTYGQLGDGSTANSDTPVQSQMSGVPAPAPFVLQ
jgi:alpha-tubulin suppressor-like RCC1 family protein/chitodextrinase